MAWASDGVWSFGGPFPVPYPGYTDGGLGCLSGSHLEAADPWPRCVAFRGCSARPAFGR